MNILIDLLQPHYGISNMIEFLIEEVDMLQCAEMEEIIR